MLKVSSLHLKGSAKDLKLTGYLIWYIPYSRHEMGYFPKLCLIVSLHVANFPVLLMTYNLFFSHLLSPSSLNFQNACLLSLQRHRIFGVQFFFVPSFFTSPIRHTRWLSFTFCQDVRYKVYLTLMFHIFKLFFN